MTTPMMASPVQSSRPSWRRPRFSGTALLVTLVAGIVLVTALAVLSRSDPPDEPGAAAAGDPAPGFVEISEAAQRSAGLSVVSAEERPLPRTIEATGVVTPQEGRVAHMRPLARGVIERVWVARGDRVTAGQALVTYDNIELGTLIGEFLAERAALRQAEADLDVRRRYFERAQEWIALEAIAQQTLELRQAEHENARAAVAARQARVAQVEEQLHRFGLTDEDLPKLPAAENRDGHREASHNVLRAPFAGVVIGFDASPGEVVEAGRDLFTVADLTTVWILADVYERDLGLVRPGVPATVRVEAYPDRAFAGRLTYVADVLDPETRTAQVRCVVANHDGALKLEMFARVSIDATTERPAIVVPEGAIQRVDDQPIVFVRAGSTRFERRAVRLGQAAGDWVEVTEGLGAGEVVAGTGSFTLKALLLAERIGGEG